MKVSVERLPESRVQLEVELDPESIEKTLEATYRRVAAGAKIAGFRPGKAPRPLVMQRLGGRQGLIREALDKIVPDAYNAALEDQDVDAIDQPDLEIVEIEPVRFKATVSVRPTVELNDYKSIAVEPVAQSVTDEEIAGEILAMRHRMAIHVPVDRSVAWNDILIADIEGSVDGEPFIDDQGAEFALVEGNELLLPGLAEEFLGMSRDETKEVEFTIPDDFRVEQLRSKTANFRLQVREVKEEELPDEDDEFASQISEDISSIDELRAKVRDELVETRDAAERARQRNEAIEKLVAGATLDYPRILVEREIDHVLSEGVGNDAARYRSYLQAVGRSHEEFRETLREGADERVKASLVIGKLAEVEGITASSEDVDEELRRIAGPMGEDSEQFRALFQNDDTRQSIRRRLETQRTIDRLTEIAIANAANPPAEEDRGSGDEEETADESMEKSAE